MLKSTSIFFRVLALALLLCSPYVGAQTTFFRNEIDIPTEDLNWSRHVTTKDGGTLMTLNSRDFALNKFVTFIKFDAAGNVQWNKRFGPFQIWLIDLITTRDSGYFFTASYSSSDGVYVKLDQFGNVVFSHNFQPPQPYVVTTVQKPIEKNNGGFYLASNLYNTSSTLDHWHLLELDAVGSVIMSHIYQGAPGSLCGGSCNGIDTASNGDIFLTGYGRTQSGYHYPAVLRADPMGSVIWYKAYVATGYDLLSTCSVKITGDHLYLGMSCYNIAVGGNEIGLIKIGPSGNIDFGNRYSFTSTGSLVWDIQSVENGNVVLVGNYFIMKTDSTGNLLCSRDDFTTRIFSFDTLSASTYSYAGQSDASLRMNFYTSGNCGEVCYDQPLMLTTNQLLLHDSILTGDQLLSVVDTMYQLPVDLIAVSLTPLCTTLNVAIQSGELPNIDIFPSPTGSTLHVSSHEIINTICLHNSTGESVKEVQTNTNAIDLDVSTVAAGLYFVHVNTESGTTVSKVLIQR